MSIPEERMARGMDLIKAMRYGLDECLIALGESYPDLADEDFWRYPVSGRHNVVTLVMHCLQQHDDFNGNLQVELDERGPYRDWHFLPHGERFELWGVPQERLPRKGDVFPTVTQVCDWHEAIHQRLMANIDRIPEEVFLTKSVGPWPCLCDLFFRATYHTNAHVRQIWLLRGTMGLTDPWPRQHYA